MGSTAAAAAVIAARERGIVQRFRDANATDPSRTQTLDQLGVGNGVALRRLRRNEVIRETHPGAYYLDEPVWIAVRRARRRLLFVLFAIVVLAAAGVFLGVISQK